MEEDEQFEAFFKTHYDHELMATAAKEQSSITVDFKLLDRFDHELADKLLNDPENMLKVARKAIQHIDLPEGSVKLEPRFTSLPIEASIRIRSLRSEHIGKFISTDGVVRSAADVRPEISIAIFECPECYNKIEVDKEENFVRDPQSCDSCKRRVMFRMVDQKMFDSRWIVIEEPHEVATAERPGQIKIYLKGDLTSPEIQRKTDPGNRLLINGILHAVKRFSKGKMKTQMEVYLEANYVEATEIEWEEVTITPEDEEEIKNLASQKDIYEKLIASIAPSIYGLEEVKAAIILQLFGGVPHTQSDKTKIRGDIHILLLGDPSTAKSQLLKLVSTIIPRGKYVSGGGVTGTGLTATVYYDDEFMGGWVLEAGAMVLANKGVLCIDEFDKIDKNDQSRMHEALEQQTVSIAKASIVATLPAQVSVLAGANPKLFRFDPGKSVAEQIDIPDTLLSRFDLKFAMRDIPDRERDEKLASHVLETRLNPKRAEPLINPKLLRKYIAYSRKDCVPEFTREAAEKLKDFYINMRSQSDGNRVAITLRQNEALLRLAEASAKIRLSNKVEVQDAERAISVMLFSLKQLGYDETGKFDIDRTEGIAASKRTKIIHIIDIIEGLEKNFGKLIPREEIISTAADEGIDSREAEELIDKLIRDGTLYYTESGKNIGRA